MIFAAILAGGIGSRMHISDIPKQFLPLGDKPVIVHTLEKFIVSNCFDHIYLGIHPHWVSYACDLIKKFVPEADNVHVTPGGADRNATIRNVISAVEADFGADPEHIIVTHDAVRPFLSVRIIQDNVNAAREFGACDTVTPATDTIVASKDGKVISEIPARSEMYQGQTPQSFKMELLKKLYREIPAEELATFTDACKLCVSRGIPVHLVQGAVSNLKLTTVEDYRIAQAMLDEGRGRD